MKKRDTKDIYETFYLGYAGSAKIYFDPQGNYKTNAAQVSDGTLFSLTNAAYTRKLNIPKTTSFFLPYSNSSSDAKSEIRLGFGVYDFNGSISFELTDNIIKEIWQPEFFNRKGLFHLKLNDGMKKLSILNCAWSNIQIDASPHAAIGMSISFISNNGRCNNLMIDDEQNNNNPDTFPDPKGKDIDLVRYWETGVSELGTLESFTLSFSRNVSPIYHNNNLYTPTYLRVGRTDVTASLTCLDYYNDETFDFDSEEATSEGSAPGGGITIWVNEKNFVKFKQNVFSSQTYNISGMSEIGTKVYEINSLSKNVTDNIFTIGKQGEESTGE